MMPEGCLRARLRLISAGVGVPGVAGRPLAGRHALPRRADDPPARRSRGRKALPRESAVATHDRPRETASPAGWGLPRSVRRHSCVMGLKPNGGNAPWRGSGAAESPARRATPSNGIYRRKSCRRFSATVDKDMRSGNLYFFLGRLVRYGFQDFCDKAAVSIRSISAEAVGHQISRLSKSKCRKPGKTVRETRSAACGYFSERAALNRVTPSRGM